MSNGVFPKLILARHGESSWNALNLFTGWVDIPLSKKGIVESLDVGKKIAKIPIDIIFTSSLIRAQMTAMLAMSEHESGKVPYIVHSPKEKMGDWSQIYSPETKEKSIPAIVAWQLNERMYGELQGMNKQEMRVKFGDEQVHKWRRSYDQAPPEGESLKMTAERTLPYFRDGVVPQLKQGKNVLISAHGNSLRSIVMELDGLSKEEVIALEIKTGAVMVYEYRDGKWRKST